MADEVSNRVSRDLLPMLRERGIDPAPFFAGLSFTETTLGNARGRIGWDEFTIWLERVELAVGGPEACEHLAGELLATRRALQILGTLAVGTFELYSLGIRIGRSLYRITTARLERLPDGRYRFECRIPAPYRGSLAFMHATFGSMRVYPRLIGLPESRTGLTVRTVRTYVARIYHALGAHSRGELVALLHHGRQRGPRAA